MAATIFTPHYGIAKYGPQGDATPMDVYGVYNPAMDTIDQILFDLKGQIDALKKRVDAIDQQIQQILQRLANIEQRLTNVENDINQLQQDVSNLKQTVNNLNADVSAIWQAIRNILAHVQGDGTVDTSTGNVTWGTSGTIAVGNINVTSGSGFIRCHAATDQANDLRARV